MKRIYSVCLSLAGFFLLFFAAGFTYAGGGPVEFTVDPNTSLNPGEQYIVHARVYANGTYPTYCKNCLINLAFENPQNSDYIAQNSDRTDDNGTIYAKVISKIPGKRTLIVKDRIITQPDGSTIPAYSYVILNYLGETPTPTPSMSNPTMSYSLSFSSDPVSAFWPTPPNSVEQMEAFLYKYGDYTSVKQLQNLSTLWTVDPTFLTIKNTGSVYFDRCPQVNKEFPCIMFYAQIITNQPGKSTVKLRILQANGQELIWNSYPINIINVQPPNQPVVTSQIPSYPSYPPTTPHIVFTPTPTGQPRNYEQEIKYLQEKVAVQEKQIQENTNLLQKVISFLAKFFPFFKSK